jgi:hypothetical protein
MDYKPYSPEWSRKRVLREAIHDYLEDTKVSPEVIGEDIKDILEEWINEYSSRASRGKSLRELFR